MKTTLALALAFSLCGIVNRASAQPFSIDWHSIDSGGGTSTGGDYSMIGSIAQPVAGQMSGGDYTLEGGFLGIIDDVGPPAAPVLRVFLTSNNTVVVAWSASATGFKLQENNNLMTTNWTNVNDSVNVVSDENQVVVPPVNEQRFYRLFHP